MSNMWAYLTVFVELTLLTVLCIRYRKLKSVAQSLISNCESYDEVVKNLRSENERLSRLEKTHREMNEDFERQAKESWNRFHAAGLAAGAAQSMLLTQLEAAVRELNKYLVAENKEPIEVHPSLREIVRDFKREHVV